MSREFGSQSMYKPLRRVLVRRPDEFFGSADPARYHYSAQPDLKLAQQEHDKLVQILRAADAEIIYYDDSITQSADAIYVHDPCLVTDAGALLLSMGKPVRQDEPSAIAQTLSRLGIPALGKLEDPANAEGGDLLWIDSHTLAVGQGFRTNRAGLEQLQQILSPLGVEVIPVPLPYYYGPSACLHLMSLISIIDKDLAVIYQPLMPVPFWSYLQERGFHFVKVPEREFGSMGANVLALAPRDCLVLKGNPLTRERLEAAGCRVQSYVGNEISLKAEGGPTCLTRPILRAD